MKTPRTWERVMMNATAAQALGRWNTPSRWHWVLPAGSRAAGIQAVRAAGRDKCAIMADLSDDGHTRKITPAVK
jgi:hypothetical protein